MTPTERHKQWVDSHSRHVRRYKRQWQRNNRERQRAYRSKWYQHLKAHGHLHRYYQRYVVDWRNNKEAFAYPRHSDNVSHVEELVEMIEHRVPKPFSASDDAGTFSARRPIMASTRRTYYYNARRYIEQTEDVTKLSELGSRLKARARLLEGK